MLIVEDKIEITEYIAFLDLYNHALTEIFCNNQLSENEILKFNPKWYKIYEKEGYICWSLNKIYIRKYYDQCDQL